MLAPAAALPIALAPGLAAALVFALAFVLAPLKRLENDLIGGVAKVVGNLPSRIHRHYIRRALPAIRNTQRPHQ